MIFPVALIALLLCTGTVAGKKISECDEWVCFASKTCLGAPRSELGYFEGYHDVNDDCSAVLMIKPQSKGRWLVNMESWASSTSEVKVLHDTTELFTCKSDGTKTTETSLILSDQPKLHSSTLFACTFFIGDGSTDVLTDRSVPIKIGVDSSPTVEIDDVTFIADVKKKLRCDQSNVQFEVSDSPEIVAKLADVQLLSISCADPTFRLQYKSVGAYADTRGISCVKENGEYHYKTSEGQLINDGPFHARCYAKVCSFCTAPPALGSGAPPTFDDDNGCKTLTCPKFFKIDGVESREKAACKKTGDDEYKWAIGGKIVESTTRVECAEELQCKKLAPSSCAGDCSLNVTTGQPYCPDAHKLISTINGNQLESVGISCDKSRGVLVYSVGGGASADLPEDAGKVSFSCKAVESKPQVASAGVPGPLMTCLMIATVLSLALIGGSIALFIWKRMKEEKKKEEGEKKETKPEEN